MAIFWGRRRSDQFEDTATLSVLRQAVTVGMVGAAQARITSDRSAIRADKSSPAASRHEGQSEVLRAR